MHLRETSNLRALAVFSTSERTATDQRLTQNSAAVAYNCVCSSAIEKGLVRMRPIPCCWASARTESAGWAVISTQLQRCTARMASKASKPVMSGSQ